MIAIVSDTKREEIGTRLYEECIRRREDVCLINISDRDIKPCYACGGCEIKSYGRCVFRDDCDEILQEVARAETVVFCFPLTFGGVSFDIKKLLDKMSLIGSRFYKVRHNELVKGLITGMKRIVAVAVKDGAKEKEKQVCRTYIREVANLMDVREAMYFVSEKEKKARIRAIAGKVAAL